MSLDLLNVSRFNPQTLGGSSEIGRIGAEAPGQFRQRPCRQGVCLAYQLTRKRPASGRFARPVMASRRKPLSKVGRLPAMTKLEPSCPKRLPALASHKATECNAEPMAKAPAWRGRGLRVGVERQLRRGGLWPAAGLVDTEIRFSNLIGGFHAATSVQPRIQA